ncbi:hypothetical protein Aduo_003261 [Ancylostoma duodenale]
MLLSLQKASFILEKSRINNRMRSIAILLIAFHLVLCQSSSIDCKFERSLCGWTAESPWSNTDKTFLPSPLNLSPMTLIGDGAFMTAQGYFGSNTTADLISAPSEPSQSLSMLSFKYTKTIGDANLQIMLKEGGVYRNLDTISTNMLAFWIRRTLVVPPTNEPYQIVFRVSKLRTGFDFISIDDVMLRSTGKSVISADEDLIRPGLAPMSRGVEIRELRRSPTPLRPIGVTYKPEATTQCSLVKCSFKANACSWSFDKWKLLNGKIVTESQLNAWLSSEPVLLPMNAHFELDIFASESSEISVYQKFGAEESLIWTQSGITLAGWNRIRLPMRFSPLPSKLLIKTSTRPGQLVAVTNTNIVDESGRDLACGGNLQVIRPRSDNLIRLTAIQVLDSNDLEPSTMPTLHLVSTTTQQAPTIRPIASHLGSPIAPPIQNSLSITEPRQQIAAAYAALPISPTQVSSNQQPNSPRDFREARPPILRLAGTSSPDPLSSANTQASTMLPPPIVAQTKRTPTIQELISGVPGQPMLEGQLKYLAKKFGFDRMSGEQAARRLAQIQRMLAGLKQTESPGDKQPISPVNAKELNSIPPDLVSRIASLLPSSRTINGALTNRITQFIAPPRDHGDDSKPFSRNNIDFVIQNAYNAYMNQARP